MGNGKLVTGTIGGLSINFQNISLAQKPLFDAYFNQHRYENAHFNFTNLFMWRTVYSIQWAEIGKHLILKSKYGGQTFMLQPFGPDQGVEMALEKMANFFTDHSLPFVLRGVEQFMVNIIEAWQPGYFCFNDDRDNYDYVYNSKDLIELRGRKYHSKKNHINSFRRNYANYQYQPLTAATAPLCIENLVEWCLVKGCDDDPTLKGEKDAIIEVFNNWDAMGLSGGVITVNGKVEAFTFGELLNQDTAVIHVEKANPDIRGVYTVINQQYCENTWQTVAFINREEDMGLEGLRKAKESYCPVKMIEKFVVTQYI